MAACPHACLRDYTFAGVAGEAPVSESSPPMLPGSAETQTRAPDHNARQGSWRLRYGVLYPQPYLWFVFFSSLDIMFTWVILHHGGTEANALANWIIEQYALPGLAVYKFGLVAFVLIICELVGRARRDSGAMLVRWAIALSALPVVVGAVHVARIALGVRGPGSLIE